MCKKNVVENEEQKNFDSASRPFIIKPLTFCWHTHEFHEHTWHNYIWSRKRHLIAHAAVGKPAAQHRKSIAAGKRAGTAINSGQFNYGSKKINKIGRKWDEWEDTRVPTTFGASEKIVKPIRRQICIMSCDFYRRARRPRQTKFLHIYNAYTCAYSILYSYKYLCIRNPQDTSRQYRIFAQAYKHNINTNEGL